jgi:hypothetical protein
VTRTKVADATICNQAQHHLDARQLRAVDLVAIGKTDTEVAEEVGVDRTSVWRWRTQSPWFQAAVSQRREATWSASCDKLRALVPQALEALEAELVGGPNRVRAALGILRVAGVETVSLQRVGATDVDSIINSLAMARRPSLLDDLRESLDGGPVTPEERASVLADLERRLAE